MTQANEPDKTPDNTEQPLPLMVAWDDLIGLSQAAELCGKSPHTLCQQAEKGLLIAKKIGREWVTTRPWLELYLNKYGRNPKKAG